MDDSLYLGCLYPGTNFCGSFNFIEKKGSGKGQNDQAYTEASGCIQQLAYQEGRKGGETFI